MADKRAIIPRRSTRATVFLSLFYPRRPNHTSTHDSPTHFSHKEVRESRQQKSEHKASGWARPAFLDRTMLLSSTGGLIDNSHMRLQAAPPEVYSLLAQLLQEPRTVLVLCGESQCGKKPTNGPIGIGTPELDRVVKEARSAHKSYMYVMSRLAALMATVERCAPRHKLLLRSTADRETDPAAGGMQRGCSDGGDSKSQNGQPRTQASETGCPRHGCSHSRACYSRRSAYGLLVEYVQPLKIMPAPRRPKANLALLPQRSWGVSASACGPSSEWHSRPTCHSGR